MVVTGRASVYVAKNEKKASVSFRWASISDRMYGDLSSDCWRAREISEETQFPQNVSSAANTTCLNLHIPIHPFHSELLT
jgi:hypothetical protein